MFYWTCFSVLRTWQVHHRAAETSWNRIWPRYCNCHICPIGRGETSKMSASASFPWKGENQTWKQHVWMMQIMYCMTGAVKLAYKKLGRKKTLVIYTCTLTLSKVQLSMINNFPPKVYDIPKTILQFESWKCNKHMYMYSEKLHLLKKITQKVSLRKLNFTACKICSWIKS